jgi:hypothetical protein
MIQPEAIALLVVIPLQFFLEPDLFGKSAFTYLEATLQGGRRPCPVAHPPPAGLASIFKIQTQSAG